MFSDRKRDGFKNEELFVIPDTFLNKISKNPLSKFLTVTDIGYFPAAKFHYVERVKGCPTAIFIYCKAGSGSYIIDNGKKEKLSSGQVIIIPPDTHHAIEASKDHPYSIYWVHVNGPFFHAFYENIKPHLPLEISDILSEKIIDIFRQCFSILHTPYESEDFLYVVQLVSTMFSLINCARKPGVLLTEGGSLTLNKAITFMHKHIYEMITREQLLAVTQISSSQLTGLFKNATGLAPIAYFLHIKIHAASKELCFSKLPIRDIAATYGIDDPYYFSRLFKKIKGISPKEYRDRANIIT